MPKSGVLVIEDSGIGIEKSDVNRIFEKGFTGYNGHTDKKSSGLGLYLCKRVCTQLGHEISVESEVGKGTKITLSLPINHKIEESQGDDSNENSPVNTDKING